MSLDSTRNNISRCMSEIAALRKKDADEALKESRAMEKQNRAIEAADRASSISITKSRLREAERAGKEMANVTKKRADVQKKLSDKQKQLDRYKFELERKEKQERDGIDREENNRLKSRKRLQDNLLKQQRNLELMAIDEMSESVSVALSASDDIMEYDVFISHASEDKDSFVRNFANLLRERGVRVWYDEFTLKWGDSLRREIDKGLAKSKFGIVVLSKSFFAKNWTQHELDGLVTLELNGESKILPIWHEVSKDQVRGYSSTLADKKAANTALQTAEEIADDLEELLKS